MSRSYRSPQPSPTAGSGYRSNSQDDGFVSATSQYSSSSMPDEGEPQVSPSNSRGSDGFVTEPPRNKRGLTGKISTLFRRDAGAGGARGSLDGGVRRKKPMSSGGSTSGGSRGSRGSRRGGNVPSEMEMSSNPSASSRGLSGSGSNPSGLSLREGYSTATDDEDDRSTSGRSHASRGSISSSGSKRIFYSSHGDDDDSEDSFESRTTRESQRSRGKSGDTGDTGYTTQGTENTAKTIVRYRGFSTSIKNLFLDETVVCASMGCFGLILSNRTEYLLNLRNERRGALKRHQNIERKKLPSRVVAYGLLVTIILMFATFVVWGFGTGSTGLAASYFDPYDDAVYYDDGGGGANWNDDGGQAQANNDDGQYEQQQQQDYQNYQANNNYDGNNNDDYNANNYDQGQYDYNNNQEDNGNRRTREAVLFEHPVHGVFKIRDYQENLWDPIYEYVTDEWQRRGADSSSEKSNTHGRLMEDGQYDYDEYNANQDESGGERDIANNIRIALLFAFLLFLGILGRRRRMRTRFYLVRARAQEDHLYYASTQVGETKRVNYDNSREDQYEGACSHTLCGCYPADEVLEDSEAVESVEVSDSGVFKRKKKPHNEDVVARCFSCIMGCFCGFACKCWFQCLSICALAQEAREIRLLVPPRYQRIDFITHQPFHEYQKEVNDLRRGWLGKSRKKSGLKPHWSALSRLSRYILVSFLLALCAIVGTLVFNPRAAFSWPDAVVLGATFMQSFLVLFVVHWIFHKSDLSLDAVVKFFAAGFLIAVPSAFIFEAILVNVTLMSAWSVYEMVIAIGGETAYDWFFDHWRIIWFLGELFNAFFVAAVTEEVCKYYTFRAVEHPDLVFLTGLTREKQDTTAVEGGIVKYPFASHQVQELNKVGSFGEQSHFSHRSKYSQKSAKSHRSNDARLLQKTGTFEDEYDEDETDARTHRQRAMAITTGMISVAVGLACAENFLYVFVLGGASSMNSAFGDEEAPRPQNHLLEEWMVLFFRSIFPIHALSAALQSINMIRKFVEGTRDEGHRIGVGRILLPAVLLHGSFDAVLMSVNVFQETAWDAYLRENNGVVGDDGGPYNPVVVDIIAWCGITVIMLIGILWYYRENRKQRDRLKVLEQTHGSSQSESEGTWENQSNTIV